jgi:antitoxin component of RelBE/YafQ-DinJ toxin-antitoxin module
VTQIRPRIDEDLAAEVQAYADAYGISFTDAVKILLRNALRAGRQEQDAGSTP